MVKNEMETLGYCQVIKGITRSWENQADSLVDQSWTNSQGSIISHFNEVRSFSDHNVIGVVIRSKDRVENGHEVERRSWKKLDIEMFKEKIGKINWDEYYRETDVNLLNDMLENTIRGALDELAPMKGFQQRKGHVNWMNNDLKEMMKMRDDSREVARRTKRIEDWNDYRKNRNKCNKELKRTKDSYYKEMFEKT